MKKGKFFLKKGKKIMKKEKKFFLKAYFMLVLVLLTMASPCLAQSDSISWKKDTLFINTTSIGAKYHGYNGSTPVVIAIHNEHVLSVTPLPNRETRSYFNRLRRASLFNQWNGLSIDKALAKEVDAVSGATYSSEAVIGNVREGLTLAKEALGKQEKPLSSGIIALLCIAGVLVLCAAVFLIRKKIIKRG